MQIHFHRLKCFKCDECQKQFNYAMGLKKHKELAHAKTSDVIQSEKSKNGDITDQVTCPICFLKFSFEDINDHADKCSEELLEQDDHATGPVNDHDGKVEQCGANSDVIRQDNASSASNMNPSLILRRLFRLEMRSDPSKVNIL